MNNNLKRYLTVILGDLLCACAITYFFIPHKLLSGGVGGISIMLQYLTNYSTGIFMFLINLPLFFLGFKKISKKFMIATIFSAVLLSLYLMLLKGINFSFKVDDILLSAVFGGVINGVGMGLLFRASASQGGLDILAVIAKKDYNMDISQALMVMNLIIVSIASFLFGIEKGMYTLISMYIAYHFVDVVINGIDQRKQLIIISEKSIEIANKIMVDPHRGITLFQARGAYTGNPTEVIYCVAHSRQIARIKEVVNEIDDKAFISISNMVEVKGKGFTQLDIS